jgi:hypothetical protein
MPLTASFVRDAKGRDKANKVSDGGGGLYIFVQPSGQRYWRLAYRWVGNQGTPALGVYPAVGLMDVMSSLVFHPIWVRAFRLCEACGAVGAIHFAPARPDPLVMRIRDLAATRTRYGCFRIYILLRREG